MTSKIQWSPGTSTCDLSAPNTWRLDVELSRPKGALDFDAIVVGSGIGGLTCASALAKRNFKVLVVEKHFQVGGFCSSFKRSGFTFIAGVADVSGVSDQTSSVSRLVHELGLSKDDLFVLNTRLYVVGGKQIYLDGTKEGTLAGLTKAFPDEAVAIAGFFDEAERALRDDPEMLRKWSVGTYQQKLDETFRNPEIKAFFSSLLGYMGVAADQVPPVAVLGACVSYFLLGGHYLKGGPQHLADTLRDYITAHHGMVMTRMAVEEVLVANGKVKGVRTKEQTFSSPIVIGNVDAKTLCTKLLSEAERRVYEAYVKAIAVLPMSRSLCMVQVGTDLDLSSLPSHILVLDPKERCMGIVNSNADRTLAPEGQSSVTFFCSGDYKTTPLRGTLEYEKKKEERARSVLDRVDVLMQKLKSTKLSDHIVVLDVATPRTFERYTSMPEGAIYGFDQTPMTHRPYFKTPIQGLYLASASTANGGGVESVMSAGFRCADDIAT